MSCGLSFCRVVLSCRIQCECGLTVLFQPIRALDIIIFFKLSKLLGGGAKGSTPLTHTHTIFRTF